MTIPDTEECFAFIYSIGDPHGSSQTETNAQILGPDDSYIIQNDKNITGFHAHYYDLRLGNCFKAGPRGKRGKPCYKTLPEVRARATFLSDSIKACGRWTCLLGFLMPVTIYWQSFSAWHTVVILMYTLR